MQRHAAEERIRAALAQDDPAAIEWMWDRYAADLFVALQARLGSRHDAEDVLQAVFVGVVRKRRRVARARCLDAYVHQMARNEAVNFLRRRRQPNAELDAQPWLLPVQNNDRSRELAEEIWAALARLPQAQREIVVLKVYRGKTFREIARVLDLSLNTVASRYRYGLEKLRTLLQDCML